MPSAAAILIISTATSNVFAPSSVAGRGWQWISIIRILHLVRSTPKSTHSIPTWLVTQKQILCIRLLSDFCNLTTYFTLPFVLLFKRRPEKSAENRDIKEENLSFNIGNAKLLGPTYLPKTVFLYVKNSSRDNYYSS